MFYCQACATKKRWPDWSITRSWGPCEICKKNAECFDVPSRNLPLSEKKADGQ